jgi:hypothetical protein
MDCDNTVPRVNYSTMERYINQRVKLVCKVEQVMGSTVQVTTPDNAQVTIIVAPNSGAFESRFVEVEGTVMDPKTIREDEHTSFGDNIGALPTVFVSPPSAAGLTSDYIAVMPQICSFTTR